MNCAMFLLVGWMAPYSSTHVPTVTTRPINTLAGSVSSLHDCD